MQFLYLYHGDLYSDLWKSDLYFSPAALQPLNQVEAWGYPLYKLCYCTMLHKQLQFSVFVV